MGGGGGGGGGGEAFPPKDFVNDLIPPMHWHFFSRGQI